MKKRQTSFGQRQTKKDGLVRLQAESRRFQDELRSIQSSLSCHHQRNHVDSSEESSENSAWDSPETLKQLDAAMACIKHNKSSLQLSPDVKGTIPGTQMHPLFTCMQCEECCANVCLPSTIHRNPTWKQCVSCAWSSNPAALHHSTANTPDEYNGHNVGSVPISDQYKNIASSSHMISSSCLADEEGQSQQDIHHNSTSIYTSDDITKRDVARITATTVFTANGGNLVFTAPGHFAAEQYRLKDGSVLVSHSHDFQMEDDHGRSFHIGNGEDRNRCALHQGHRDAWKSTTTVSFRDDPSEVCAEPGVKHSEQNKETQTDVVFSTSEIAVAEHLSTTEDRQQNRSTVAVPAIVQERPDSMEAIAPLHGPKLRSFQILRKLRDVVRTSKDSIMTKCMASKIRSILQTIDSRIHVSHNPLQEISQLASTSRIWQSDMQDQPKMFHKEENLGIWQRESQILPNPESYLENVILALSLHKSDDRLKESLMKSKIMEYDDGPSESRIKKERKSRLDVEHHSAANVQITSTPDKSISECLSTSFDIGTVSKRDSCTATNEDDLHKLSHYSNQEQNVLGSYVQSTAKCVKQPYQSGIVEVSTLKVDKGNGPIDELVANNYQTPVAVQGGTKPNRQDQDTQSSTNRNNVEACEHDSMAENVSDRTTKLEAIVHDFNSMPILVETTTSLRNTSPTNDFKKSSVDHGKSIPAQSTGPFQMEALRPEYGPTKLIISQKSMLDLPVDAAAQAANELARHLAQGESSAAASSKPPQVTDAQHDRTKHAIKAVQALLGDGFDYSSMYQDLKVLQGERRKLELRAKTTVSFQQQFKGGHKIVSQVGLGGEHLLRRKAETGDPLFSGSGSKRQRTTKSPIREERSKRTESNLITHNNHWKKPELPIVKSSLELSIYDFPTYKEQNSQMSINKGRIEKALSNHIQRQRQFNAHKYFLETSGFSGVKTKNTGIPGWVERLTKGNRSSNLSKFFIRDSATSKNLVQRKSVRPPGSIFKASNPIRWTSKPLSMNEYSQVKKKNNQIEKAETSKLKHRLNSFRHHMEPSNKSDQDLGINEEVLDSENKNLIEDGHDKGKECEKTKEDQGPNELVIEEPSKTMSLDGGTSARNEPLILKSLNRYLPDGISDVSDQKMGMSIMNSGNDQIDGISMLKGSGKKIQSRGLWDADLFTQIHGDNSERESQNNVTQDDLLALTLRSILNSQPSSSKGFRFTDEENNIEDGGTENVVGTTSLIIEDERKQDCKSVQTMENAPCDPSHFAVPSFPLFPTILVPNGNMVATPQSIYMPCSHPNHSWIKVEQGHLCSGSSSSQMKGSSAKNAQKGVKWRERVYTRDQEIASSTTTPSTPASIHEVEDICETGWDHMNDASFNREISNALEKAKCEPRISDVGTETDVFESQPMLTGTQKVRELPDAIHDNKDHPVNTGHSEQRNGELGSLNRYQISKDDQCSLPHVGQHEVQTERSQLERKSDSSELNLAVESPGNPDFDSRVSVDEATETRKRLTLIPYQDHIYPSAQSSARSLNSRGPSWALVVRDSLPYVKVPMVPSWREIKRPMMFTSSSDTDAASSSDTHTSSSIGELQQKALTILRKSAPTSFARNNAAEENSEGEVAAASKMRSNSRSLSGDLEQGEIITRKSSRSSAPNLHGIETRSSSEGEMSLGRLDPEELA